MTKQLALATSLLSTFLWSASLQAQSFKAYLYDEEQKAPVAGVGELREGMQVDGALLQGLPLNIQVVPSLSGVQSMAFTFNGGKSRNENELPFTVLKETGAGNSVLGVGTHSFTARAYSQTSAKGKLLGELRLSFSILAGPDQVAPTLSSTKIEGQFTVTATFNEEAQAHFKYKKKDSTTWKLLSSTDFKSTHVFTVTDAEAQGWHYALEAADRNGNRAEFPAADLLPPKPAKDYDAMIAEQFVKGDRFAKKNAAHLAKNKKHYVWPKGRSKSNPHDCYIVSRAYHDHMKFYEKGYAPIRSLYMCP
jgi:hypothetical protein